MALFIRMIKTSYNKLFVLAFAMMLFLPNVFGQRGEDGGASFKDEEASKGSTKVPIVQEVKAWHLVDNFSKVDSIEVDSAMFNFHNYNPVFQDDISNTYLGYMGAPYQSNYFFNRTSNVDFYFLRNMEKYLITPEKIKFYNTRTPFSFLKYTQSLQSQTAKEQTFQAFFTQNVDSSLNFGINFNTIKNEGPYKIQQANHKHFSVFASKNSERYNSYYLFSTGNNNVVENGGITDNVINPRFPVTNVAVNLPTGIKNDVKSLTLFTKQEYIVGRTDSVMLEDSTMAADFLPILSVSYNAEFKKYSRIMTESSVNTGYFENTFIQTGTYIDTLQFRHFEHYFQLKALELENKRFTFGKRAFAKNEIVMATHPLVDGSRKYTYSNVSVGGEIYQTKSKFLQWSANAELVLLGRNIGDAILKGKLVKPIRIFGDTIALNGIGWYADKSPDIYQEHLILNHERYDNNFKKQHEVVVKGNIDYERFGIAVGVDYALLSNYLYNNSEGVPDQYNSEFSVFGVWAEKDFRFWRFGSQLKVKWQELSNDKALHLPTLSGYGNIYYQHYLFKVMEIQLGAEIYYNTKFYADHYNVSTNQFYYQNDMEVGGFPLVNAFVNAKLARTSAFFRVYNITADYGAGNYFGAPYYPLDNMAIRFGFYWSFYD